MSKEQIKTLKLYLSDCCDAAVNLYGLSQILTKVWDKMSGEEQASDPDLGSLIYYIDELAGAIKCGIEPVVETMQTLEVEN